MFRRIQWRIVGGYVALLSLAMLAVVAYLVSLLGDPSLMSALAFESVIGRIILGLVVVLAFAAALAVPLAISIARSIGRPIAELTDSARRLAEGDDIKPRTVRSGGEVGELAATFNDMAERVRHHVQTIEDERARLSAVLAHIPDGVVIADAAGEIVLLNPAAGRLLRTNSERAPGKPLIEVARDHELVDLVEQASGADAPEPRLIELGPQEQRISIQAIASRLPRQAGAGPLVLLVLQDVTELRRTEAIRRDFVANVSHELRTPVASLKAMVEALEEGALDDPPAARDFLSRMNVEVDELVQLIEELLELSRIESGRQALRLQLLDPGPVVAAAAARLQPQADRQGLTLDVEIGDQPARVLADPERLQQALVNLMHNAIKFTPPGGNIRVQVDQQDRDVHVRVHDTGVGITRAELDRLFERFYKADKSRASGGTGLGLAIVKHLVQAHGGRIWAESPGRGRGATFTIALPVAAPDGSNERRRASISGTVAAARGGQ